MSFHDMMLDGFRENIEYWSVEPRKDNQYILQPTDEQNAFLNNSELAYIRRMGYVVNHVDIENREVWIQGTNKE